jgi:hypothetical protein
MRNAPRISTVVTTVRTLRALTVTGVDYIGAGTGSLIIQVVLATTLGGLVALKLYWKRIKAFFSRKSGEPEPEPESDGE